MSRFGPIVKVPFADDINQDNAAKVGKFIDDFNRLSVKVDAGVRGCLSGDRLDEDLRLFLH